MDKKLCFTINPLRTTEDIKSYRPLIENNLYQGIEIFYPYQLDENGIKIYHDNINGLIKGYNIEVVLHLPHGPQNDLLKNDINIMNRFKKSIDFARSFNCHKLTLHLGSATSSRENDVICCINNVKELCTYAYPMNIMIENMPRNNELGYSIEEIVYIIKMANQNNLKFILDFGHANVSEFEIVDYIKELKLYLYHLHLSDNLGNSDSHKPIGWGNINYKNLINDLQWYNELYCMEILYNTVDDLIKYRNDFLKVIN